MVLLEGPLDRDSLARVVAAGTTASLDEHLFDLLERRVVTRDHGDLFHPCKTSGFQALSGLAMPGSPGPLREMVSGLKSWLAFFTLWSAYLKSRGWQHSVDLEVHQTALQMGRRIVFLETIEEQIRVLENLPQERFVEFLKAAPRWEEYTRSFVRLYLRGEAGKLKAMTRGFPSRHASVIDGRDRILYERALPYLQNGSAMVCVGAPHIEGISAMLQTDGFEVRRPPSSLPSHWRVCYLATGP